MWGGRFGASPDAVMEEINVSIDFDRHLFRQDIAASKAHAAMLAKQGIIPADDARKIAHGLDTILSEIEAGKFEFKRALEDIHMNVESRLAELIGPAAGRLHTARSRNDQVATDFRLWVRATVDAIDAALADYQRALAEKALEHAATVMPGFTHLQTAQPVTFGHHLLAYVEMAARDRGRFADARKRGNESPLGAAALAGTAFPLDRAMTARNGSDACGKQLSWMKKATLSTARSRLLRLWRLSVFPPLGAQTRIRHPSAKFRYSPSFVTRSAPSGVSASSAGIA